MHESASERIQILEAASETTLDVESVLSEYNKMEVWQPVWQLVQDIERQAMVYVNVIELLKAGQSAATIRCQFEYLGLVPPDVLPNPEEHRALEKALDKLARFRQALLDIAHRFGHDLLSELGVDAEAAVSLGVAVGFPPALTIAFQYTATVQRQPAQWTNKRPA
jgi:hypothetical protein